MTNWAFKNRLAILMRSLEYQGASAETCMPNVSILTKPISMSYHIKYIFVFLKFIKDTLAGDNL